MATTPIAEAPVAPTPPTSQAPSGEPAPDKAPPASPSGGGLKAWLPLLVTLVTMPALAYVTTVFLLVPKMQKSLAAAAQGDTAPDAATKPSPAEAAPAASKPKATTSDKAKEAAVPGSTQKDKTVKTTGSGKTTVPLSKMLVNVAGTMGSRYLQVSVTLASNRQNFAETIQDNEPQLIDLATGVLAAKTLTDLEKPEARSVIRSELMTVFNNVLGPNAVQEVYFTDFAIQ